MRSHIKADTRACLIGELSIVVTDGIDTEQRTGVVVESNRSDAAAQIRMHDAERPRWRLEVIPEIRECPVGLIVATRASKQIVRKIVASIVEFKFRSQSVRERITPHDTRFPTGLVMQ